MPTPAPDDARPVGTWRRAPGRDSGLWQGEDAGAPVSGFVVAAGPGEGPGLHVHPYAETFVVLAGRGRFTVGERTVEAAGGDVLVVPGGTPHRFVGLAPGPLRMVTIHSAARMVQHDLQPPGSDGA